MTEIKDHKINLISLYFLVPAICTVLLLAFLITGAVIGLEKGSDSLVRVIYSLLVAAHLTFNLFVIAK